MKYSIKQFEDKYTSFPKIEKKDFKKLYHLGYYDGALSGVCLVNGEKYYFDCIEEWTDNYYFPPEDDPIYEDFSPPWARRFLIIKLPDNILSSIEERHKKFQQLVGNHTDYDDNGKRSYFVYNDSITPDTVKQYYKEVKTEVIPEQDKLSNFCPEEKDIIGWYEWE